MKQRYFCVFVVLFIAVLCQAAASERTYNVLFIQSYTSQTPWHRDLNQGLVKGFKDNGLKVNITTEYLDADFWAFRSEKVIMRRFCERARDRETDLIVTSSDEAFYTLFACGDSLPLQIPVVFFGIKYPDEKLFAAHPNVCGYTVNPDFDIILREAQRLFPKRKEVICVIDNSFLSNKGLEDFQEEWEVFQKDNPDYDANDPHVGLVHRIDKDTSGLLVIAKTPDAKTNLGNQFFNKTTKRKYRALVWGIVEQDEGTIIGNIARNPKDRMQMAVMSDPTVGKHAVTHYRVLERLGYVTLVECILETGRTHQIRVHMKHIGHVLFNDERYGGHEILKGTHFSKYKQFVNNCFDTCPRQALHAMTLGFVHPVTGEEMYFTSELPDDMTRLIEKWRGYISNRELE